VRVPFADYTLLPTPLTSNTTNATAEINYLFTSDIFATAWGAIDFSGFVAGDTVAVFGAGPVGLLAAYSAILRGASKVYVVDYVPDRLNRAASIGAVPISFNTSDPVQQILEYEPDGVNRALDCVGYESFNAGLEFEEGIVLRQMIAVAARQGGLGVVGEYAGSGINSTAAPLGANFSPNISVSMTEFFGKSLSMRSGGVNPQERARYLLDLLNTGVADLNFIVSKIIDIEEAPEYYARFNRHEESKVIIQFP
jgi:threonine dehydrogenase-like Zn-dependent dehydrogenase